MEVVIAFGAAVAGALLTWLFALPTSRSQTRAQRGAADAHQELAKTQAALAASQAEGVQTQQQLAASQRPARGRRSGARQGPRASNQSGVTEIRSWDARERAAVRRIGE